MAATSTLSSIRMGFTEGSPNEKSVDIISADGQRYTVPTRVAEYSMLIKEMPESIKMGDAPEYPVDVSATILRALLTFCMEMDAHPHERTNFDLLADAEITDWQQKFIAPYTPVYVSWYDDVDDEHPDAPRKTGPMPGPIAAAYNMLKDLQRAAQYMMIDQLAQLVSLTVARSLENCSIEEMRDIFGTPHDPKLTKEEEEENAIIKLWAKIIEEERNDVAKHDV